MNLNLLDSIKVNALLNLSSVHMKKKNYKLSIDFSKQVSLNSYTIIHYNNIYNNLINNLSKI